MERGGVFQLPSVFCSVLSALSCFSIVLPAGLELIWAASQGRKGEGLTQPGWMWMLCCVCQLGNSGGAALCCDLWDRWKCGREDCEVKTPSEPWVPMQKVDFFQIAVGSTQNLCQTHSILVLNWLATQTCNLVNSAQLSGCLLQSVSDISR